ncbi:uncharacterized protein [Physcomitrium patens]|uniref:UBA domain-containing protein n=2 Tax=Physcomitrium patens TaxID=3218 RepID=A0A2K1L9B1_PHYPA|nr:uncharacterized protein LOC112275980 isoform X4 [Physcomitrium patens]PNR62626.1 hypothetical protein PHYPA_001050 [Physcomitrium patens]|eukprot:XP_024362938.1 uncharacterized protein LOC112275980 isoform X4 [Physcomitrella patens]
MTMAPTVCPSLHVLEGHCEYCGELCDSTQGELNALVCTFEGCPSPTIYHQHCIEAYFKTIRLDKKQRKNRFQCPRGRGKGSKTDKPCLGRVTKSHSFHSRIDSSKKWRNCKLPEISPPTITPTTLTKKEKEDNPQPLSASKSVKIEENDEFDTTPKLLILNRASAFPSLSGNNGNTSESISVSGSSSNTSSGVKVLSRESTLAAIAAARSEIAANKRGPSVKNNTETYASGRLDHSITSLNNRLAQNSKSDDDSSRQFMNSKDFRKVLSVGRGEVEKTLVTNAWARGRCNELLNGFKQNVSKIPPLLDSLNSSQDVNVSTSSTSVARPPVRQPTVTERLGLGEGEDDDLEARRLKARTKNEKKHLQRAARAREKREAEEATLVVSTAIHSTCQSKQHGSEANFKPWNESLTSVIRHNKFHSLVKQLQEYGFADWQSNLAVRICGNDVEQCLDWLLRNSSSMQADMRAKREEIMDITLELNVLKGVLISEGFSQEQVEVAVISTDGDINEAVKVLRSSRSYLNSPQESSQDSYHVVVSPRRSFGQPIPQSSSDLAAGWDGVLNDTTDDRKLSPLSGTINGADPQQNLGLFSEEFISDVARCNSKLGLDNFQPPRDTIPNNGSSSVETRDQSQVLRATSVSQRNAGYFEALSGGLQSHLHNSFELTTSTVTSVAAAVLSDTFGFDEQMISRMMDLITVNEAPLNSTVNTAALSLNGIWSSPSSIFTSFAANKEVTNNSFPESLSYMPSNKTLDGRPFINSPLGAFGERPTEVNSDLKRTPLKNGYSHAGPLDTFLWEQQSMKLNDEAEQDLLMSELLSQLLV